MKYDEDELFSPEGNRPGNSDHRTNSHSGNKPKKSGTKTLLILLAIFGGLSLLCCCGIGISLYSMVPEVTEDPVIAQENLSRLLKIEFPEGYDPKGSIKMSMFGFVSMNGVFIRTPNSNGVVMILGFSGKLANDKKIIDNIRKGAQVGSTNEEEIDVDERKTHDVTIDGKVVTFRFLKGKEKESNKEIRQVQGVIPGKEGPILFMMSISEEDWDEEQALKIIESIEVPK